MVKSISNKAIGMIYKVGAKAQKHAPELLMAGGTVSFVATIIFVSRATTKSKGIVARYKDDIKTIREAEAIVAAKDPEEREKFYSDERFDPKGERLTAAATAVRDLGLTYLPAVGAGALTLTCFYGAHHILARRYIGAVAAFNALSDTFETYRGRVREEVGEEMDRHYMYGTEVKQVAEVVGKDADGNDIVEVVKEEHEEFDPDKPSVYAKVFDEENCNFDVNPTMNLMFLRGQETVATNMLHARGHLFLNEVYDMLGFERNPVGAVVGWIMGEGEDYVSFGLDRYERKDVRQFLNGKSDSILLDFNVAGVIWDKI